MEVVIDQPHLIDTLRYRVMAYKTLAQEEVRVTVTVIALERIAARDPSQLERSIREALGAFIAAEWTFSRLERKGEAGYERVSGHAYARVKAAENYDLAERARLASREGLTISFPNVDYSLSRERIDVVFDELRLEILQRVAAQARAVSDATGRDWRLGDVAFGTEAGVRGRAATAKGAYRDFDGVAFAEMLEDDGPSSEPERILTGAERITLVAAVVLKSAVREDFKRLGPGGYVIDEPRA
jgi:hypothetical protein